MNETNYIQGQFSEIKRATLEIVGMDFPRVNIDFQKILLIHVI